MLFEKELKVHSTHLANDFSSEEIKAIIDSALIDIKNRNIVGAFIVPLSYLVGGLATDYAAEQHSLYAFLGFFLFVAMILRILSIVALSKNVLTQKHIWVPVFFWSNILFAVIWASFTATAILFYHDALSLTLIIILLAGIGAGSMASYCIWKVLAYAYLLIILAIPAIAEFYVGNSLTISIGIAISFFLAFNLVQTKVWNKHYWQSLINSFVIKKYSQELEEVNTRLTDEIEDHKETAKNIVISRKKLQDIYNSAHDGILILNLDGQVIDSNATMLEMFKMEREEALKLNIHKSFQSSINTQIDLGATWNEVVNGNEQEFTWLTGEINSDNPATVQVNLKKTLWGKDSVVIATVRDITQRVAAMEATIAANKAKTEFLANMSHELRTPLHGILGYTRLGLKHSNAISRKKILEYFQLINISGKRLTVLLNNLLDFSKMDAGKMRYTFQKTKLLPIINSVTTELNPIAAEKKLSFYVNCENKEIEIYCDSEKIMQVLRNLIFNAIKFSNEKSPILLTCEKSFTKSGRAQLLVSVQNYGIPIPENELALIFEKFIQSTATNTGAGGTGLGLAISKQIIHSHGGSIWAENRGDGSTTFSFLLPVNKNRKP